MNGLPIFFLVVVGVTFIFCCIMLYIYKYENLNKDLVIDQRKKMKPKLFKGLWLGGLIINIICIVLLLISPMFNKENVNANQIVFFVSFFVLELAFFILFGKKNANLLAFAGIILASIFLFHISLQIEAIIKCENDVKTINWIKAVHCIVFTFQTFTLDLDYIEDFFNNVNYCNQLFNDIGRSMVIIFALIAPATGGFVIIDILANIFPLLKLWLGCILPWKRNYYIFSELNEYSIETAESILKNIDISFKSIKKGAIPLIIFTDVYTNNTAEDSSELLIRAKKLGAICLKQDITELKLFFRGRVLRIFSKNYSFFLMDKIEENNLKDAISLMSIENGISLLESNYVKDLFKNKVSLYVFTQSSDAPDLLSEVRVKLEKSKEKENFILCKVINEYQNLVYRLIDGWYSKENGEHSYPLYFSKQNEPKINALTVCLIGSGRIGTEFIKAAYWCGQILKDKNQKETAKLNIIVYSKNALETLENLKFEMPGISFVEDDKFAKFEFKNLEYGTKKFEDQFLRKLLKIDYILIALGNDLLNFEAANWIKRVIDIKTEKKHIIPINYIIEDKKMCDHLTSKKDNKEGCILNSFGSLESRYKIQNIILQELEKDALAADRAHGDYNQSEISFLNNFYNRNSSMATALHFPYKYFSINRIIKISRSRINDFKFPDDESQKLLNLLFWLEHRRWMAYMQTVGYQCPNPQEMEKYIEIKNDEDRKKYLIKSKKEELKFHTCMIEGDGDLTTLDELKEHLEDGIWKDATKDNLIERLKFLSSKDPKTGSSAERLEAALKECVPLRPLKPDDKFDSLDRISVLSNEDYKKYDIEVIKSVRRNQYVNLILQELEDNKFSNNLQVSEIFKDKITRDSKYYCRVTSSNTEFIFLSIWRNQFIVLAKVENDADVTKKEKQSKEIMFKQLTHKIYVIGFKLADGQNKFAKNPVDVHFTLKGINYHLSYREKLECTAEVK